MDQRQLVVQRAYNFCPDGFETILIAIRQDRDALRGWEEPAHLRATLRRSIHMASDRETATAEVGIIQADWAERMGEPEPAQQREALGLTLETGAGAIEKLVENRSGELTYEETFALTAVLILYARPAMLVSDGELSNISVLWRAQIEDQREAIESNLRAVGRIDLIGHPEFDWAGTGVLVGKGRLLTTRHAVETFAERVSSEQWRFRPGVTAWMDFQPEGRRPPSAACRVQAILGVHEHYDLAVLEVEAPSSASNGAVPIMPAAEEPPQLQGRSVYMVGYPIRDSRRTEPELLARMFRDIYNVKRVQPGLLQETVSFNDVQLLKHDCGLIGRSGGSCIIDMETQQMLGLCVSGRFLEHNTAIPLWMLREDPMLRDCGITFSNAATAEEIDQIQQQVERLARSRYWDETQSAIADLYQRVFRQ